MNHPESGQLNNLGNRDEELAFLSRAIEFMDGAMNANELASFNSELQQSEAKLTAFASLQLQGSVIRHAMRQAAYDHEGEAPPALSRSNPEYKSLKHRRYLRTLLALAATSLLMAGAYFAGITRNVRLDSNAPASARLVNSSNAAFFGELLPAANSGLQQDRDYVLTKGLVELSFPSGALAIIESPSVFRIIDDECLAIDAGRCSVHAPDGAEGFRVQTPTTQVVDRGTRFVVSVNENSTTEVQMIEGAADVYPSRGDEAGVHLVSTDARRFPSTKEAIEEIPFSPQRYRMSLPDRIVSYEATESSSGRVDELQSVTVQRGGKLQIVPVEDLIGINVTHFRTDRTADPNGHFACGDAIPADRLSLLEDNRLATGIINPGGSPDPLTTSPDANTPGLMVRFKTPVINGPGPDVVFFELQSLANPLEGDAFHVSPVAFTDVNKSVTIRSYDLTLTSPETKKLAGFSLYRFLTPIDTAQQLVSMDCQESPVRLGFRAIAVGIDLSELGFGSGDSVEQLFFQDASDDEKSLVDPVFIAGLPSS